MCGKLATKAEKRCALDSALGDNKKCTIQARSFFDKTLFKQITNPPIWSSYSLPPLAVCSSSSVQRKGLKILSSEKGLSRSKHVWCLCAEEGDAAKTFPLNLLPSSLFLRRNKLQQSLKLANCHSASRHYWATTVLSPKLAAFENGAKVRWIFWWFKLDKTFG